MKEITGLSWLRSLIRTQYIILYLFYSWITFHSQMVACLRLAPIRLDGKFIIKDYEIVYPFYLGKGETTLRADPPDRFRTRQKRNARLWSHPGITENLQSTSQLNISGLGQTFLVKLETNSDLLAPGFQVYYRSNGSVRSTTWPFSSQTGRNVPSGGECLYRGDIISHHSSLAAFSMCGGHVFGMLMTDTEDYVIEPVRSRQRIPTPVEESSVPHVMYRTSSLRQRARHYEGASGPKPSSRRSHRERALKWPYDRRRRKRAAYKLSQGLTAELLVVADKSMYYAHKKDDVIMYTLSIMNIVSQLYKDSSLGTTIKITLVGLVIMQSDEPKLKINHHAGETLQNFCQWQAGVTGTYGKHDHAVLLTALDICSYKNEPCDTLGYAPIEGMCDSTRSCSINEDTGLATGYTVAHEMGHNLAMFHDGSKGKCPHATGTIMSPKLTTGGKGGTFKWSSCSRNYLIQFLHTQQAKCLWKNSLQVSRLRFPNKLPGEIYPIDQQCAWLFEKDSKHCEYNVGKNLCRHLWCQSEGHLCQTKYLPAADGTTCGENKWCMQGNCVLSGRSVQDAGLTAVNGGWSDWGTWSDCSRSCGGGVRQRERRCDNPRPLYGGEPCKGINRSYRLCNTQECDGKEEDFRSLQCRRYERQPFHGSYYKWRPYTSINQASDQCKLYCQALGYDFITALSNQVQDGTPCNEFTSDVCVEGSCKGYGCDMIIDSEAKEDNCGVCRGDNSTCRVVKGEFRLQPRPRTYFPITVIPKQSRHIHISEKTVSHNYLAIRDIYGRYYLNGDMNMNSPGVYTIGGAHFEYRRTQNMKESLVAKGPLKQDIVLEVLIMGRNPGIEYDYTLPTRRSPLPPSYGNDLSPDYPPSNKYHPNQYDYPAPRETTPRVTLRPQPTPIRHYYSWRTKKMNCSEKCATGEQTQHAECWLDQRYHVNPGLCDPKRRPFVGKIPCNTQPCDPRWVSYEWRTCSRSCGGGKQSRKVRCRQRVSQKGDRRVDKRMCARHPRPTRRQWCNTQDCPAMWIVAKWSQCSVSCDSGIQTRTLSCGSLTSYGFKTLTNSACRHLARHVTEKTCRLVDCPEDPYQWVVSSWSKCSTSCGVGVRTRALRCSYSTLADRESGLRTVDGHYCSHITQPSHIPLQEVCTAQPCPRGRWHTSPWTECSVSCGNGLKTRRVFCEDVRSGRRSSGCDWPTKPQDTQRCNAGHCPIALPYRCVDQFNWCDLVPKHNVCRHTFYGTRCCQSCRSKPS